MSTVVRKITAAAVAAVLPLNSAGAVGLGPLVKEGLTNSERKGFYLTLINPYPTQERFRLYSLGWDDEVVDRRVLIPVSVAALGPQSQRRLLVIDTGLAPGEEHKFRVCAERVEDSKETLVHARVCSKLTARRIS